MQTYMIIRFFQDLDRDWELRETGLSLEEAQAWCNDPETSSRTCKDPDLIKLTDEVGPWFDGYQPEPEEED